jgi:hypothetical protein
MKIKQTLNDCNSQAICRSTQRESLELKYLNQPLGTPLALVLFMDPSIPEVETGTPSACREFSPFLDPLCFGAGFFVPTLELAIQLINAPWVASWAAVELILFKETFFLAPLTSGYTGFFLFTKLYLGGGDDGVVGISRLSCKRSNG